MGVIIGLIVGYVMGAKAGENELEELKEAWATIRGSEEAHDMMASGLAMARTLVGRGGQMLVERLQAGGGGDGASTSTLRPTG